MVLSERRADVGDSPPSAGDGPRLVRTVAKKATMTLLPSPAKAGHNAFLPSSRSTGAFSFIGDSIENLDRANNGRQNDPDNDVPIPVLPSLIPH